MRTYLVALCMALGLAVRGHGVILSGVVTGDTVIAAGEHVVSGVVEIAAGVVVHVTGPSTVRFDSVSAGLRVMGTLQADGVFFAGTAAHLKWGQIWLLPGSTGLITSCHLDNGGGNQLPPPATSNAMVYAEAAVLYMSNSVVTRPQGDCVAVRGGTITFVDNVVTAQAPGYGWYAGVALYGNAATSTKWTSSGNSLYGTASAYPGIWLNGTFQHSVELKIGATERVHFGTVVVSNTQFKCAAGATLAANDFLPGSFVLAGGTLVCEGTPTAPILWTNFFNINVWPGITWLPGSTGVFSSVTLTRAIRHVVSNAYLSLTDVRFRGLSDGIRASDHSIVDGEQVVLHGMVNNGVSLHSYSSLRLRNSQFMGNNAPYVTSLSADATSAADARFCWWNSSAGPYPFGPHGNETVTTNGNSFFFPWLLAAPGAQTNPPVVEITSPAAEPYVTSDPQVWLEGMVRDDGQVVSVIVQNAASPHRVQVMPDAEGMWRGQIWLYEGMNALAVYAYDEQGNAAVDARLVECRGAGVGRGSARPLTMAPMPSRTVRVGELVRARCVATSPDSCVLTYWAQNVPPGGVFDQELRELRFIPVQPGVAHVIEFFACDGKNVAKTSMTIDVVRGAPSVGIRTKSLPSGYRYFPYTYRLIADNAVGPVTWSYSDVKLQDGITISRAGVISGVPLKDGKVNFLAIAQDTRGGAAASNFFTLDITRDMPTNGIYIPFQQVPVCVSGAAYTALTQLSATNGVPAYAWYDASDVLSDIGMTLGSNGVIAGTPTQPGIHGWLPVVRDQSNATAHAELALPVIAPEHRLKRMAGLCKGKLLINRVPGSQTKGSVSLKMRFTPPAGFTFDQKSPVVAQIGVTQIAVPNPFKYVPGVQLVFKKVDGMKSTSVSVKYKPGIVQASFTVKKVNLTLDFEQYGIRNENVLVPKTANIPVWVRIGNYEMATELMPLTYTTKVMKSTKGTAAW